MADSEVVGEMSREEALGEGRATAAAADAPEVLARFTGELELVHIIASQVARTLGRGVELDDLLSAGREGLLDAARRFDAARGVPFRAYANFRVRGAIVDGIRQVSALPRRTYERLAAMEAASAVSEGEVEFAFGRTTQALSEAAAESHLDEHLGVMATAAALRLVTEAARDDATANATETNPEDAVARAELMAIVRAALAELSNVEREVVTRHDLDAQPMSAIAMDLNVSKSWISRVHTRALARLTKKLQRAAS